MQAAEYGGICLSDILIVFEYCTFSCTGYSLPFVVFQIFFCFPKWRFLCELKSTRLETELGLIFLRNARGDANGYQNDNQFRTRTEIKIF